MGFQLDQTIEIPNRTPKTLRAWLQDLPVIRGESLRRGLPTGIRRAASCIRNNDFPTRFLQYIR
jgi:hypothetical protein